MNDDAELLRAYAIEGSEPAFRELVGRHLPLVQATARRIVAGDMHLAQDVTQTVFTDLAQGRDAPAGRHPRRLAAPAHLLHRRQGRAHRATPARARKNRHGTQRRQR